MILTKYASFITTHLLNILYTLYSKMSVMWTKEMAEAFLESKPDPLFPCHSEQTLKEACVRSIKNWGSTRHQINEKYILAIKRDKFGRCTGMPDEGKFACANCNCRMLFNELKYVKADLETTKETLRVTANDLDETMVELGETKVALEECKKRHTEEKRKFTGAIAKMVQSEMKDVRAQLSALNMCLKEELGEKALEKKAASEAAKAALCASKFIKLRLLMF